MPNDKLNITSQDFVVADDGARIHVYRAGAGPRAVVLIHGLSDDGLCWWRLARHLQDDFALVLMDARGHGLSDAPDGSYSAQQHARDAAAIIRALGLAAPAIIGHSMGADTAAALAADFPELVRGVVLEDPPWRSSESSVAQRTADAKAFRDTVAERRSVSLNVLMQVCRGLHPDWADEEMRPWAEAKQRCRPSAMNYVTEPRRGWQTITPMMKCPTLLVIGDVEKGGLVSEAVARDCVSRMAHGSFAHVAGAGHSVRRENFADYHAAVAGFLAGLNWG